MNAPLAVRPIDVRCDLCGADPGDPCCNQHDEPLRPEHRGAQPYHRVRIKAALRAEAGPLPEPTSVGPRIHRERSELRTLRKRDREADREIQKLRALVEDLREKGKAALAQRDTWKRETMRWRRRWKALQAFAAQPSPHSSVDEGAVVATLSVPEDGAQ